MTEYIELGAALAPEEAYAGHANQGVDDQDKECIERAQEAKSPKKPRRIPSPAVTKLYAEPLEGISRENSLY